MGDSSHAKSERPPAEARAEPADDSLCRRLTPEERSRLAIDAWEPSLLRKLLSVQNKDERSGDR